VSDGDRMERGIKNPIKGEKPSCKAKTTPRVYHIGRPLGGDSNKRSKVIETVKNNLVRTVLGGGRMEGRLPECTVLDSHWEESKVNETDTYYPV
jgi:hypothetical protein